MRSSMISGARCALGRPLHSAPDGADNSAIRGYKHFAPPEQTTSGGEPDLSAYLAESRCILSGFITYYCVTRCHVSAAHKFVLLKP